MILVDTNVLIDISKGDAVWYDWSAAALDRALSEGLVCTNEIVFAELSFGYSDAGQVEVMLDKLGVVFRRTPNDALYLAGRAYWRYRRRRGTKTGVLPDFFIGAHAAVEGAQLLTRDARRIKAYFPTVEVIAP